MLTVIDHTEHGWDLRYRKHGRVNGARTYSEDIVDYHIPLWQQYTEGLDVTVGTCGRLLRFDTSGDIAVQYLHEYPYKDSLDNFHVVHRHLRDQFQRVIFVTAYKSLALQGTLAGYEVWHVPMAVVVEDIKPIWANPSEHRGAKAAAYYGNIINGKAPAFREFHKILAEHGWGLTTVSGPQMDCWHELTKYDYVVAVGRCALEAGALGRKVMFMGAQFGGIVTNEEERMIQLDTNCNGRVITFDREVTACLDSWDSAVPFTNDIVRATRRLEGYLAALGA